jgi:hypothetical protein
VRESEIERYFVKRIRALGYMTEKWGTNGNPDRIVFWGFGRISLVELKTATGVMQPTQKVKFKQYWERGQLVYVLRSKEDINNWIVSIYPKEKGYA